MAPLCNAYLARRRVGGSRGDTAMTDGPAGNAVLYEPDDRPPAAMTIGLGTQYAFFALGGIIMVPLLVFRAAGVPADVLTWAVFASILVCGLVTMTLALRVWRVGAGYILMTNTTGTAIAVGVDAVAAGGVALLASLVLVCSLLQFALSFRLSLLRRVVTPTVSGVVLMLIPVTVMPVVFERLDDVPDGAAASTVCALATLVAVGGIMVKGGPKLRPWAPLIGLGLGSVASAAFGLYDIERVLAAGWIAVPENAPGLRFDFGADFLRLLPAFLLVFVVCTVRTTSASLAIQGVSWRTPRTVDFRPVQGAVAADAVGNALAGLAGTVPNCVRATTVSLTELSGVAARRVGLAAGCVLLLVAFLPKIPALVIAVPGPVIAGYITVVTATIFTLGMKMIVADGLDTQKTLVVALSFWIGVGCEYGLIFPEIIPHLAGGLMSSGLTAGGLVAIALSGMFELTAARRRKLETELGVAALPAIRRFLEGFAANHGWSGATTERLAAAAEETLLTLERDGDGAAEVRRRLLVVAYREGGDAMLEFIAGGGDENIEDRLSLLKEGSTGDAVERDVSLRLLRHLADEVRHRQYHDADFISVRVVPEART